MHIGEKIRKVREIKGFSQDYMASKLNISQAAYSKIEKDITEVSLKRLEELALVLEVDLLDLLKFDDSTLFINTFNSTDNKVGNMVLCQSSNERELELLKETIMILREELEEARKEKARLMVIIENSIKHIK